MIPRPAVRSMCQYHMLRNLVPMRLTALKKKLVEKAEVLPGGTKNNKEGRYGSGRVKMWRKEMKTRGTDSRECLCHSGR